MNPLYESNIRKIDLHFLIRLLGAAIATHFILIYGEPQSTFELLVNPDYWMAYPGSFVIAFILIECVYRLANLIDKKTSPNAGLFKHASLQFLFALVPMAILAFLLAAIYFKLRGINILDTTYLIYDFQYIILNLLLLNTIYFFYFNFRRWNRYVDLQPILENSEQSKIEVDRWDMPMEISKGLTVPLSLISYFFYDGKYIYLYTLQGEKLLVPGHVSLSNILDLIGTERFFRINRNMIVSQDSIIEVKSGKRRIELLLEPPFKGEVIVSKRNSLLFREWSGKTGTF